MKKILIAVALMVGYSLSVMAADSPDFAEQNYDVDEVVEKDAKGETTQRVLLTKDKIVGYFNKKDEDGKIVAKRKCTLEDWEEITVPASCSDGQYTNQVDCEDAEEVWTAATIVEHNDFTSLYNSIVQAGQIGKRYFQVIGNAVANKCKNAHYGGRAGTVE